MIHLSFPVNHKTIVSLALGVFAELFALSFSYAGVNQWTSNGPDGGQVYSIVVNPETPTTLYVGTAHGGVFKSTNGGGRWTPANTGLPSLAIQALAIDPQTPTTLYAGVPGGVFKSTNGGGRWTPANTGLSTPFLETLAIDPQTPTTLYVGTTRDGVFKSTNGGGRWTPANTGLPSLAIQALAIDPQTSTILYVSAGTTFADGVFKSVNGGGSWFPINSGLPSPASSPVTSLVVDPQTPIILYAGTNSGVFKSMNGGGNWNPMNAGLTNTAVFALAINPQMPLTLYAATFGGIFKSTNGGGNWNIVNSGLTNINFNTLVISPQIPAILYAGTRDKGVFKSTNGGSNWNAANDGLSAIFINALAIDPEIPTTLYAGTIQHGAYKSINGGESWSAINATFTDNTVNALAVDPQIPTTLYAGTGYGFLFPGARKVGVYKSIDEGKTWAPADTGLPSSHGSSLAIDPQTPSTLYVGVGSFAGQSGVYKSLNGGLTWNPTHVRLSNSWISSLAIDPQTPTTLYTGAAEFDASTSKVASRVYKSINGGLAWTALNLLVADKYIFALAIDPQIPTTIYAGTGAGMFKSVNGGLSWSAINTGLTTTVVYTVAIDPETPMTLYIGTFGGGVFKSTNGGASWRVMNRGLTNSHIKALVIDPQMPTLLYAGTGGNGVFGIQQMIAELSITDVTQVEGNSGTAAFTFTVSLSPASTSTVTVNYATATGSATAPSDYTAVSGALTFTPGQTSKLVTVNVLGNTTVEPNENFRVNLSGAVGATIFDGQGVGTILNDDGPVLRINDVSRAEGNSGTRAFTFTVSLSPASASTVTVSYATANGTATAPSDYTAVPLTLLTFAPGQLSKLVTVNVLGNTTVEPNENFRVNLSGAVGATIFDGQGVGTILNDDGPVLRINDVSRAEGNSETTAFTFTVTLSPASASPVTINYATANGSALAGSDYTAKSGTLRFAPGQTRQLVTVPVLGNTTVEPNEVFTMNLSGAVGATIFDGQGVGTILNDDGPVLQISDVSRAEGNSGTTAFTFAVSLSPASASPVTVKYATANGSALAGSDYTAKSGTLTFAPGQTRQLVTVPVLGNTVKEFNEVFTMNLSSVVGATIIDVDSRGIGTILNDDGPVLRISDISRAEGNSGTTAFTFAVSLSPASASPVTVKYATANGSALAGSDYTAKSGTLTFTAGQLSKTITVNVAGNTLVEPNENFRVNLSNAVGATIFDGQGVGTILNDDGPVLRINNVSRAEGNSGSTAFTFTVTLSPTSASNVMVNYTTANGTATAGSDYTVKTGTLTFTPGQLSKTIIVNVTGNRVVEPNETFFVNLRGAVGATIFDVDSRGVGTILNDDGPTLRINNVSFTEGNVGTKNFVFTVTLSSAAASNVTVNCITANGSATAPSDYTAVNIPLTFTPGQTSKPCTVPVIGNTGVEPNEFFTANLTNVVGPATIFTSQGRGTILNND